jgi:Fe-S-cluster containining protein
MSRLPIVQEAARPLPTVRALEKLWDEVAERPLWAGGRFFKYLRLRAKVRLKFADPKQFTTIAPEGKVNDCSACYELCCVGKNQTVSLRFRDIATLIDIDRVDLITQTKPKLDDESPARARTAASDAWRRFPVLAQNSYGACNALSTAGKCTLYPYWPTSCARFPYTLEIENRVISYSPRCRSFWIRPDVGEKIDAMKVAAVAAYNERIKDLVLLAYAPERLAELGLARFIAD